MNNFPEQEKSISFFIKLIFGKYRIFTDSRNNKLQLVIIELLWITRHLFGLSIYSSFLIFKDTYHTKYGIFRIHRDLQSAITISPTFEYEDIHELLSFIDKRVKMKKKILFIDIGAHIGLYSVCVGRRFKKYNKIDIVAFEPNANNFFLRNTDFFLKNIELNSIRNVRLYEKGLGSKDSSKRNKFGFYTSKLDTVLGASYSKNYDSVFIKVDIEGYEEDALRGAEEFLSNAKECILMVEDCVDRSIIKYMKNKFEFLIKVSPYNSFWMKANEN